MRCTLTASFIGNFQDKDRYRYLAFARLDDNSWLAMAAPVRRVRCQTSPIVFVSISAC